MAAWWDEEDGDDDLAEQPDLKRRKRDEEVEWMLPLDVLLPIFSRLAAVDLIRSGAVCVSWRSAVKTTRALQLPKRKILPWLLLPKDVKDNRARFIDIGTGETYSIHLPELHGKRLVGMSDHGFLVYEDVLSRRLSMINPISRETICFKPLSSSDHRVLVVSKEEQTTGTGYIAVSRPRVCTMFSTFARAGCDTWDTPSLIDHNRVKGLGICGKKLCGLRYKRSYYSRSSGDSCYQFFTCNLDDPRDFKVWDFKFYRYPWSISDFGGSIPDHERDECEVLNDCLTYCCTTDYYTVILPNGDLIVVCRAAFDSQHTVAVKVYRMPADLHGEAEIITSIGDYVLFLDKYRPIVLSTLEFRKLKANTIYFNEDCRHLDNHGICLTPVKGLVMYDLEAQKLVEYCPVAMNVCDYTLATWFMPAF